MQAAKLLGVSSSTIKRMCDEGKFTSVRTPGGHRRIAAPEVLRWLNDHGKRTTADAGPKRHVPKRLSEKVILKTLLDGDSATLANEMIAWLQKGGELS